MRNRKLIMFLLIFLLMGSLVTGIPAKKVKAESKENVTEIIDLTGIIRDKTGNYISNSHYVTREEFAQMLIQASPNNQNLGNTNYMQIFKDVKKSNTKASYIQAAVSAGYISGYLNGTFQPKKPVTLKEAIYGTLALLGYTNEDFSTNLSIDRTTKFKELGLGKNIPFNEAHKLTNKDCEVLFYNLLNTKQKSGEIYGTVLGYPVDEAGKVDYSGMFLKATKGPLLIEKGWEKNLPHKLSSYTIMRNNTKIKESNMEYSSIVYYSEKVNKLWVYNKKVFGNLDNITYSGDKAQEITIDGSNYTVENPTWLNNNLKKSNIQKGMLVVLLLGRDDKVSFVLPLKGTVANENWQQKLSFDLGVGTIYKNGSKISSSDIEGTDVVYYSNELKTLWVYGKKTYGTLESVSPSIAAPKEVVVAGKKYELDSIPVNDLGTNQNSDDLTSNKWGDRLRQNGIKEGNNVVILFGYNGAVADICTVDKMPVMISGYVLSVENKVIKNEEQGSSVKRIVQLVDTDGTIREFACSDPYIVKESIVEITFDKGKTVFTKIANGASTVSLSATEMPKIADDARIIEVNGQNYTKISVANFRDANWVKDNVIYCKINQSKVVTDLIVRNISNTFYQCGFLKSYELPNTSTGNYNTILTFDIDGKDVSFAVDAVKWDLNLGPKAILVQDNKLIDMVKMQNVRISYISNNQANTGDTVYRLADNIPVYFYKDGQYYKASLEDIKDYEKHTVYGYTDNSNGPIKIIVVFDN